MPIARFSSKKFLISKELEEIIAQAGSGNAIAHISLFLTLKYTSHGVK